MHSEDIAEETAELLNPDSDRGIKAGLHFIPFAMGGAGDLYCFHLHAATEAGMPTFWHDMDEASYRPKNLQDFLLYGLLEAVADVDPDSLISCGGFRENCQAMFGTRGQYLTLRQRDIVAGICRREPTRYHSPPQNGRVVQTTGLLSAEELTQLLGTEIGFGQLGDSSPYMQKG